MLGLYKLALFLPNLPWKSLVAHIDRLDYIQMQSLHEKIPFIVLFIILVKICSGCSSVGYHASSHIFVTQFIWFYSDNGEELQNSFS